MRLRYSAKRISSPRTKVFACSTINTLVNYLQRLRGGNMGGGGGARQNTPAFSQGV